jgi:type I restriction enzyme, S subunit
MTDSVRLKWLLAESDMRAGAEAEALPLLSVSISRGVRRREASDMTTRAASEDLFNYKLCRAGDLVINRMRAFQGALGIAPEAGLVSPDYAVLRVESKVDKRWLNYYLTSGFIVSTMASMVRGIGGTEAGNVRTPRLNDSDLQSMTAPLASAEEQRAIACYLDRETARIDTLIAEQQRLIEILRERRYSLVDGAFGGQSPNSRLQNACIDVVDCAHTTPEVSDDGEYEAVRTASVRDGKFRPGNGLPVDRATWENRNAGGAPAVGDILFTREAPAGEACMVPSDHICLGQRMVLLRIDGTACVGEFLLWQIYSARVQDHFRLSANGSTVANVRLPVLRATPIWLPDLAEQRRIAAFLNEQTAKIDTLIVETERFIELSRERRSALITAAVTGQIDVREMV